MSFSRNKREVIVLRFVCYFIVMVSKYNAACVIVVGIFSFSDHTSDTLFYKQNTTTSNRFVIIGTRDGRVVV